MKDSRPIQQLLYEEMADRVEPEDTVPEEIDGYLYYVRFVEDGQFPVYCRRKADSSNAPEEILVDQNKEAMNHPYICINLLKVSSDNRMLAFTMDTTGGDSFSVHVKDLKTGARLKSDTIPNVVSVEWADDGKTLFYTVPDHLKRPYKLYRHVLGTPINQDELLYEEHDHAFFLHVDRTKDKKFITVMSNAKTTSEVRVIPSNQPTASPVLIHPREPGLEYYIDHRGDDFLIITNVGNQMKDYAIMRVAEKDVGNGREHWQTVLSPSPGTQIEDVDVFSSHIICYERSMGLPQVRVFNLENQEVHLVPLPEALCTLHPGGNGNFHATRFRLSYASPITPECVYDFDIRTRELRLLRSKSVKNFDPTMFVCNRVQVKSHDGTGIPLTLVHKKGLPLSSDNPTLMLGYGAYGQPLEADFRAHHLPLLNRGWVIALAHVRGGGELGREWYRQGCQLNKHNSFHDFVACAEHLVSSGYTSPSRLVAKGSSAGGLLIGAAVNMRPDLFRAVIMGVPFLNPLAAMTNESLPLTIHEYDEWGNPNTDEEVYNYIKSYDPYINLSQPNLRHGRYPSMLVTTSTLDNRVPFWSPAKYVAKLRALQRAEAPHGEEQANGDANDGEAERVVLLKVSDSTGHGGEGGRYNNLKEVAFDHAFLFKSLNMQ